MKILLVGSGGREHALALALLRREGVRLWASPGSDALAEVATCLPDAPLALDAWCRVERPDLVVVGPEAPLVDGWADRFREAGIPVFGPGAMAARLEGSKAFAKAFMARHGIPCAAGSVHRDLAEAREAILAWPYGLPVVVKADGLAAGKGVVLATSVEEALETVASFMGGRFGDAGRTVVLEAPLTGLELSVHLLVDVGPDRAAWMMLPPCQDHKRLLEGDQGPNTGGMGAYGPVPFLTEGHLEVLRNELAGPTVEGLRRDGLDFRGVVFMGVMWTAAGPRLLEYNVRFGDPETQVLCALLDEDLAELLLEVAQGRLRPRPPRLRPGCALATVLAAEGYPGEPVRGVPIPLEGRADPEVQVLHAGTCRMPDGRWATRGGRVLDLVARGGDLAQARSRVEALLPLVAWPGMQVRCDIGLRALAHARAGRGPGDPWEPLAPKS